MQQNELNTYIKQAVGGDQNSLELMISEVHDQIFNLSLRMQTSGEISNMTPENYRQRLSRARKKMVNSLRNTAESFLPSKNFWRPSCTQNN